MLDVPRVRLRLTDTATPRSLTLFAYLYIELSKVSLRSLSVLSHLQSV